ncbi:MAG: type II toxin-antitoxin system VapC family toxin [Pseudonocardiaceae bacterium]
MIAFADSSALVKLYADEQDHQVVRGLGSLVVSALARVEVPAAIWRKHRMGELDPVDAAASLAGVHGLRACDAVQLASAKAAAAAVPGCRTVATFDSTLRAAAAKEGFTPLPG